MVTRLCLVILKLSLKNMRSIHSKDTSIELQLRKALWHKGYRYRKNYKALPGSPDIVLIKYKIAIFATVNFFMERLGNLKTPS